ncbi:hypothetical protein B1813_08355 [Saccharomonospora piscinae]|uniref:PPE family protein n=1 Tax=Saccharomonospora piscinae TaxID=687388 RepID=A0A1V9A513_SACPI|nr:hypothetical protein [Saccharomonospora piscinae]OQO92235.1 hypothetical protein B1813_08355 [Saccharomonospora piscinae]
MSTSADTTAVSDPTSPDYDPDSPHYDVTLDSSSPFYAGPVTDGAESGHEIRAEATEDVENNPFLRLFLSDEQRDELVQHVYTDRVSDARQGLDEGLQLRDRGEAPHTVWDNASHEQMVEVLGTNADSAAVAETSEEWVRLGNDLSLHQRAVAEAIEDSMGDWAGEGGDAARQHLAEVARWLGGTAQGAVLTGRQQQIHSQTLNETQKQMAANPPVEFSATQANASLASITDPVVYAQAATQAVAKQQEQQAAREQAARLMKQYDDTIGGATDMPLFTPPPPLAQTTAANAGQRMTADGGGAASAGLPLAQRADGEPGQDGLTAAQRGTPMGTGDRAQVPGEYAMADGGVGAGSGGYGGYGSSGGEGGFGDAGGYGGGANFGENGGTGTVSALSAPGAPGNTEIPDFGGQPGVDVPGGYGGQPPGGIAAGLGGGVPGGGVPGGGGIGVPDHELPRYDRPDYDLPGSDVPDYDLPGYDGDSQTTASSFSIPDTSQTGGTNRIPSSLPNTLPGSSNFTGDGLTPRPGGGPGVNPSFGPPGSLPGSSNIPSTPSRPSFGGGGGGLPGSLPGGGVPGGGIPGGGVPGGGVPGGGAGAGGAGGGAAGSSGATGGAGQHSGAVRGPGTEAGRVGQPMPGAGARGGGGMPMAGGMPAGGARQPEEDKEHRVAGYLTDDENLFASEEIIAPPVIGDWTNKDWK